MIRKRLHCRYMATCFHNLPKGHPSRTIQYEDSKGKHLTNKKAHDLLLDGRAIYWTVHEDSNGLNVFSVAFDYYYRGMV